MKKGSLKPVDGGLHAVELVKAHFKKMPTGVIQIGAHNGREVIRLYRSGVERAVFVDPLDETIPLLQERVSELPDYTAFQALIGDEDGKIVDFNVSSNTGESSSFLELGDHAKIKPNIEVSEKRQMTLRSLDVFLPENGIAAEDYNMLFIDTQGAEMHVLRGAMNLLNGIDFIWMEVSIGNIYQGDTSLARFVAFFEAMGYELGFCEMKRLGWGDALFVRRSVFLGQD